MSDHQRAYEEVHAVEVPTEEHKASWTHELIGSAAAFAAMRAYDKKKENEGEPQDHAVAKEILAALAGGAVDNLIETKGMDWFDRQKAKHHAKEEAEKLYAQQTGYEF